MKVCSPLEEGMSLSSSGDSGSGSVITVGNVIGSFMHMTRKANKRPDASHNSLLLPLKHFSRPTHSPHSPWPLTLFSPVPFFPVSTVAPQPFCSSDGWPVYALVLCSNPNHAHLLQDGPLLDFSGPRCSGQNTLPHKPQPCRGPHSCRLARLLPSSRHMHIINEVFLGRAVRHLA